MMKFTVNRVHSGDKDYHPGDTRDANLTDVQHLVDLGVLTPVENKRAAPVENKATTKAPVKK